MGKKVYPRELYITTENTIKTIRRYQWKYRNLIFLGISIFLAYYMFKSAAVVSFIQQLGDLGYPAAFLAGVFFSYAFTTAPATVAVFNLGNTLNPFLVALIGAAGTVLSDYLIFRLVRNRLMREIKSLSREVTTLTKPVAALFIWEELRVRLWKGIRKSRLWNMIIPLTAGFIIASPLPDEIGVALFGAIKFEPKKFLIVAYVLNFIGIFVVAYSARLL